MKIIQGILFFILILSGTYSFAQNQKATVWVNGECGMCKTRIETASKNAGATAASWSTETKQLELEFDPKTVTEDEILKKVAAVGHDNARYRAPDEVYEDLPGCCLYDRTLTAPKSADTTTSTADAAPKTSDNQFYVKGNCGSCKARIEKAAHDAGAESASWDAETQLITLHFNPKKTSSDAILKKIAAVGHDNEKYKTTDAVYEALPQCCLYPRDIPVSAKNPLVHSEDEEDEEHGDDHHGETSGESAHHNEKTIEGVTINKTVAATSLSKRSAALSYNIGGKELLKAACCNLAESFETNATVDVAYSNAVTGTKQLKMLGLDQKYTSLTKELLPEIRGLATAYGLNFIPGRWIGGIQLTKGGSTVTNGYESITGQINTELLKFNEKPETTLNVFADVNARVEANITQTSGLGEHWNQSILLHGNATLGKTDHNEDGFLDQPTGNQINATYLLNYNGLDHSGLATHIGLNFVKDARDAGQTDFDKSRSQQEQTAYGVGIHISRFQAWNKTGYIFPDKPYQSIGWMNQYTYHQQDSFFGLRNYNGKQHTYYSNLIFESIIGDTNHKYKAGASFLYDQYDEGYLTNNFHRTETVPGLFAEYTLTGTKFTLVAGARADFHNLAGTQFTPRVNLKYDFTPQTIIRLSAGRGFRTANIFAESQQYFASSRDLEIQANDGKIYGLKPEIAWNYGASLQQELSLFGNKSTLVADFFRTDFQNQVIADLDASPQKLIFYNLDGKSFANSLQVQWDFIPFQNFEARLAYKYYDVKAAYLSGLREVPFMAKHRGFVNLAYSTKKDSNKGFWAFDTTFNLVGKQRLPDTAPNPEEFRLPAYSSAYTTWNAQISKNFNERIRLYAGGENLTGYTQKNPIIDAANPFGNYFDGGMVYAPIMPANFYLGLDVKF